jgi:ribosomal protein S12 methylthiotransferase
MDKNSVNSTGIVSIIDLGCAKNTIDSEMALGKLLSAGFEFSPDIEEADLILINTCGFIESAKEESISHILNATELKSGVNSPKIIVIGCLAERYGDDLAGELEHIDGIIGVSSYPNLLGLCKRVMAGERILAYKKGIPDFEKDVPRLLLYGNSYAYLRIAEGCDNHCTYCSVPSIRGPFRSRPLEDIINEAKVLCDNGITELCLVAQDPGNYGKDFEGSTNIGLHNLLQELIANTTDTWIRLLYMHPAYLSDQVIELLAIEPRLLGYLDLPIQHISNPVLKRMGRKITKESIESILQKLKDTVPGLVLRTSLICGFPGETDENFTELLDFVKNGYFQHLGVFTYSPEEGTPAINFSDQVPEELALNRKDMLMMAQQEVTFAWLDSRIGNDEQILIDSVDYENNMLIGRSRAEAPDIDGNILISISNDDSDRKILPGSVIEACLTSRETYDIMATVK